MRHRKFFVSVTIILIICTSAPINLLYAGINENIQQWINQLADRRERPAAKNKLIEAKEEATDALLASLSEGHIKSSVMVDIIQICEKNKIKEAIPILKGMIDNPKRRFRLAAIKALSAMEDKNLSDIFKKATKDSYEHVRIAAMSALMRLKDESAISDFIESLSDKDAGVRLKALEALALFSDKSAIPALIERLNDPKPEVVIKTIDVLSDFKDRAVVEALINRLNTTNKLIKVKTIKALGKIKNKLALSHLKPLLNDEFIDVRRAADDAIKTIKE